MTNTQPQRRLSGSPDHICQGCGWPLSEEQDSLCESCELDLLKYDAENAKERFDSRANALGRE